MNYTNSANRRDTGKSQNPKSFTESVDSHLFDVLDFHCLFWVFVESKNPRICLFGFCWCCSKSFHFLGFL